MEENNEVLEFDLDQHHQGELTSTLKVSSILSWIMAGIMIVMCGLMLLAKGTLETVLAENTGDFSGEQLNAMEVLMENYYSIFLSNFIFYIISVVAVILMYKLKKIGFYIYVPLHILIMAFPYTYQPFVLDGGTIFSLAILVTFIALYGSNLKHMK